MGMRAAERLRAAENVVAQLRDELGRVGVTLPSLRVDPVSAASDASPFPLVELGRCNIDTAMRLVAVLHEARR
ncbi:MULTISPECIES: hypothetical protein [unclassified Streptomyces]|uniref:hypothetical protein n=1 Tax=unclassified Streptomyces TaxID=2593676 RepID=UPI0009393A34|nr:MULTISPECIES: hypothetical protein [unclassified Streptomyces]OKJ99473.1 hypothetical protein AMK26_25870 [Streptomyces sp. CB03234]ORT58821.1 hypothetical protein BKD26_16765 [Streptomyces sp. CB03238]